MTLTKEEFNAVIFYIKEANYEQLIFINEAIKSEIVKRNNQGGIF